MRGARAGEAADGCVCDLGVDDPFTLEAAIDGRLTQLGVEGFREWPWKAVVSALGTGGRA
jgi:ABC-type uncharacterized transport system permease subunit